MKLFAAAVVVGVLAVGCARPWIAPETPDTASEPKQKKTASDEGELEFIQPKPDERRAGGRWLDHAEVGEFAVHRFSGSFRDGGALELTERLLAREPGRITVELKLQAGDEVVSHLRVQLDDDGQVLSATIVENGEEIEADGQAYAELVEQTVFGGVDRNDGEVASKETTCLVGEEELDCVETTYEVEVDGERARLVITRSAQGLSLGGAVKREDGELLYRSELIQLGREEPASGVASR